MAKLSGDDTSWKAEGLRRRYREDLIPRPEHRGSRKKNTKKWCKGVVGREHIFKMVAPVRFKSWSPDRYAVDKCQRCGKEINFRWNPALPKPSWMK